MELTNEPQLIKKGDIIIAPFDGRFIPEKEYGLIMEILQTIHELDINKYVDKRLFKN